MNPANDLQKSRKRPNFSPTSTELREPFAYQNNRGDFPLEHQKLLYHMVKSNRANDFFPTEEVFVGREKEMQDFSESLEPIPGGKMPWWGDLLPFLNPRPTAGRPKPRVFSTTEKAASARAICCANARNLPPKSSSA